MPTLVQRAGHNFRESFRNELSSFKEQHGSEEDLRDYAGGSALTGKAGKFNRFWFRTAMAADDWNKTVRGELMVGAFAYRLGQQDGKSGAELEQFIHEQVSNPTSEAWKMAVDASDRGTLSDKGGKTSRAVESVAQKLRTEFPGIRYIIPFVHTPLRALSVGLQTSYLGMVPLAAKVVKNKIKGRPALENAGTQAAQQAIGMMLGYAMWGAVGSSDDEEAWITGNDEKHPYSIKLGGRWWSYARLDPVATYLGITADAINDMRSGDWTKIASSPFVSFTKMVKEKSMLDAVGDLFDIVDATARGKIDLAFSNISKMASNFLAGWVPNVVRSTVRATEPEKTQTKNWGQTKDPYGWLGRVGKRTLQRMEIPKYLIDIKDNPVVGLFGEKRQQTAFDRPAGDFVARLLLPLKPDQIEQNIHPGYKLISNWNTIAPEGKEVGDMELSPIYRRNGKDIVMTDDQFQNVSELAGQITAELYKQGKYDPENPTLAQINALRGSIEKARELAKDAILNPGVKPRVAAELASEAKQDRLKAIWGRPRLKRQPNESDAEFDARVKAWQAAKFGEFEAVSGGG
jgi:hypothetical protein